MSSRLFAASFPLSAKYHNHPVAASKFIAGIFLFCCNNEQANLRGLSYSLSEASLPSCNCCYFPTVGMTSFRYHAVHSEVFPFSILQQLCILRVWPLPVIIMHGRLFWVFFQCQRSIITVLPASLWVRKPKRNQSFICLCRALVIAVHLVYWQMDMVY